MGTLSGAKPYSNTEELCIDTIRVVAAEMVQAANSGHPGMPMGMAPVAHELWSKYLTFNPKNTRWPNRDRFILSNGHGCALQYILLHLSGYKLSLDDLKAFRRIGSLTPVCAYLIISRSRQHFLLPVIGVCI
jgi:transketolase